jgi:hypothetical protein
MVSVRTTARRRSRIDSRRMLQRVTGYLRVAPRGLYAIAGGLFAFSLDTAIFLAEGDSAQVALKAGLFIGAGVAVLCALGQPLFASRGRRVP